MLCEYYVSCVIWVCYSVLNVVGIVCGYHRWQNAVYCRVVQVGPYLWARQPASGVGDSRVSVEVTNKFMRQKVRCTTYLWFTGRWSGVEVWVTCPVCGMFLYCLCFVVCPLQAIPHPIPPPSRQTNYQTMPQRAEPSFSTGLRSSPLHTTKQSQLRNIPQT